jgi:DNA polymerase
MTYDPTLDGARCDVCPLYEDRIGGPVEGEYHPKPVLVVGGEAPGKQEVKYERPFVGEAGRTLQKALALHGLARAHVCFVNLLPCRPPQKKGKGGKMSDLEAYVARCKRDHKPSPVDCCRARFLHDLRACDTANVLLVGGFATQAMLRTNKGIMALRGGPVEVEGFRVVPTVHPAFVLRARHYQPVFEGDIGRAIRWFHGALNWAPYEEILCPPSFEVSRFLSGRYVQHGYWTYDVETDALEPLRANLKCLAIARDNEVMVIPFTGRDYAYGELDTIKSVLRIAFTDGRQWVGHNAGYYDRMVMERCLGVTPAPLMDTMLLHNLAAPGLRHDLETVGTTLTDVTSWKADDAGRKIATGPVEDVVLWKYNGMDAIVTSRVAPICLDKLVERNQQGLVDLLHYMQDFCVNLHKQGMYVNQDLRMVEETRLVALAARYLDEVQVLARKAGLDGLNPNSHRQVGHLLYDLWGLDCVDYTDTGAPSTADPVLRRMILEGELRPDQEPLVYAIRRYRKVRNKWLGTYVWPMDAGRQDSIIWPDGRVRADWNATGAGMVGRYSCSHPALQQMPIIFRKFFTGAPGHMMAGADADQIHLRIIAQLWGVSRLQEAFKAGGDPHATAAMAIFGRRFLEAPGHPEGPHGKYSGQAKALRNLAKTFQYAAAYGADPPTIHKVITKAEDDDGQLVMSNLTISGVDGMRERWLEAMPEFESGWEQELSLAQANGMREGAPPWLADPVVGRRRDFPAGVEKERSDIINYRIIAAESAIIHMAEQRLLVEIPWEKWGPGTGIVVQVHDSLTVECPAGLEDRTAAIVADAMTCKVLDWDVPFTASGTSGPSWADA